MNWAVPDGLALVAVHEGRGISLWEFVVFQQRTTGDQLLFTK